jgi:large subunit ribosomal protein L17
MRHRVTGSKLGRTASHRRATLSALSSSLIEHKRIRTTLAKAKATQRTIEPIITRAKLAHQSESGNEKKDVHARRVIARFIKNPAIVRELFDEIAPKVAERNGGYTRVVKLGQRDGDGAHLAILELVDYNEATSKKAKAQRKKTAKAASVKKKEKEDEAVEAKDEKDVQEETVPEEEKAQEPETEEAEGTEPTGEVEEKAPPPSDAADEEVKDEKKK